MFIKNAKKLDSFLDEILCSFVSVDNKEQRRRMANIIQEEWKAVQSNNNYRIIDNLEWKQLIACATSVTNKRKERTDALNKLLSFATDDSLTMQYKINKEEFCLQLLIRILDPNKIDQGMLGMCGPTTVTGTLIKRRPDLYAEAAIELGTKGKTYKLLTTNLLSVPSYITDYNKILNANACPEVDWVFLLALKDDLEGKIMFNANKFGGCTPNELYEIFNKIPLFKNLIWVDPIHKIVKSKGGGLSAPGSNAETLFNSAAVLANDKSVTVVLNLPGEMCKSQILNINPNTKYTPNHSVILKKVEFPNKTPFFETVKLHISTWTQKIQTGEIWANSFYQSYGGYIAAKM